MSSLFFGMVRYFSVGFGVLAAVFVYMWICGLVYKAWPRIGLALAGVLVAGFAAICAGVFVNIYIGYKNVVLMAVEATFPISLIAWVALALSGKLQGPNQNSQT